MSKSPPKYILWLSMKIGYIWAAYEDRSWFWSTKGKESNTFGCFSLKDL